MKAIKYWAATAALVASFSVYGAEPLSRQLHQSDGYVPADISGAGVHREGAADAAFWKEVSRSDGNVDYGSAAPAA